MRPFLCCLILGCLGIIVLAKPPNKRIPSNPYYVNQMLLLRDTVTYQLYLDSLIRELNFCQLEDTSDVYINSAVDSASEFIAGSSGMNKFLFSNLKYPIPARENGIEGRVIAKFIIDENGLVCSPQIIRYEGFGLDQEMIRILNLLKLQKWRPAYKNGSPVKTYYFLPITFKLT